jgi:hypothetical protein
MSELENELPDFFCKDWSWYVTAPPRNKGSIFQDPDRVILDEARIHVNTHTKHLKS